MDELQQQFPVDLPTTRTGEDNSAVSMSFENQSPKCPQEKKKERSKKVKLAKEVSSLFLENNVIHSAINRSCPTTRLTLTILLIMMFG